MQEVASEGELEGQALGGPKEERKQGAQNIQMKSQAGVGVGCLWDREEPGAPHGGSISCWPWGFKGE